MSKVSYKLSFILLDSAQYLAFEFEFSHTKACNSAIILLYTYNFYIQFKLQDQPWNERTQSQIICKLKDSYEYFSTDFQLNDYLVLLSEPWE